jgi:hypothetical protein
MRGKYANVLAADILRLPVIAYGNPYSDLAAAGINKKRDWRIALYWMLDGNP